MSVFVLGDPHGAYKALLQVMERSKFDTEKDTLIVLGDVVDGWSQVFECIQYLAKIPNIILIAGNHDEWAIDYLKRGARPNIWLSQGGQATLDSFMPLTEDEKKEVYKFFVKRVPFYIDDKKRVFVHGGLNPFIPIEEQDKNEVMWDRDLILKAKMIETNKINLPKHTDKYEKKLGDIYDEIYIGHTSTWSWSKVPYHACNVWCLDQGAGWYGKLSIMNIDTKEFWQSDCVQDLYPDEFGRRGY